MLWFAALFPAVALPCAIFLYVQRSSRLLLNGINVVQGIFDVCIGVFFMFHGESDAQWKIHGFTAVCIGTRYQLMLRESMNVSGNPAQSLAILGANRRAIRCLLIIGLGNALLLVAYVRCIHL